MGRKGLLTRLQRRVNTTNDGLLFRFAVTFFQAGEAFGAAFEGLYRSFVGTPEEAREFARADGHAKRFVAAGDTSAMSGAAKGCCLFAKSATVDLVTCWGRISEGGFLRCGASSGSRAAGLSIRGCLPLERSRRCVGMVVAPGQDHNECEGKSGVQCAAGPHERFH